MAPQLFRRHAAHCSDGLSRIRINGFLWNGRQKLRQPEVHDFRQLTGVASHKKDGFLLLTPGGGLILSDSSLGSGLARNLSPELFPIFDISETDL